MEKITSIPVMASDTRPATCMAGRIQVEELLK